jgi:hypothetical protein
MISLGLQKMALAQVTAKAQNSQVQRLPLTLSKWLVGTKVGMERESRFGEPPRVDIFS